MVHNGIEYGLMQLIAESYEIMKNGLQMDNAAIGEVFAKWNAGRLQSFLLDITKDIFNYMAPGTDHLLIDDIKDEAKAKEPVNGHHRLPWICRLRFLLLIAAVSMRDLSKYKELRVRASALYGEGEKALDVNTDDFLIALEQAFYFSMIVSYAQGMHLLSRASEEYKYDLKLAEIAKIWRGGCIIRSAFLNDIFKAYEKDPDLAHLLLDTDVHHLVAEAVKGARTVLSSYDRCGYRCAVLYRLVKLF